MPENEPGKEVVEDPTVVETVDDYDPTEAEVEDLRGQLKDFFPASESVEGGSEKGSPKIVPAEEKTEEEKLAEAEPAKAAGGVKALSDAERIKALGLEFANLEDLATAHKKVTKASGDQLEIINWAANQAPEVLQKFYTEIARAQMKARGLPVPEEAKLAEKAGTSASDAVLKNLIDPETDEPYTEEQIGSLATVFDALMSRGGYAKTSDIQKQEAERVKSAKAVESQRNAQKHIKDLTAAWMTQMAVKHGNLVDPGKDAPQVERDKFSESTQKFWDEEILTAISEQLAKWHVYEGDFDKITPEILSDALNAFIIKKPGGLEGMLKNAAAAGVKNEKDKIGTGAIPKGGEGQGGGSGEEESLQYLYDHMEDYPLEKQREILARFTRLYNTQKGRKSLSL